MSNAIESKVNVNAQSESDKPYPEGKSHDVFALKDGMDYVPDFQG